jgi:hypothetical protein
MKNLLITTTLMVALAGLSLAQQKKAQASPAAETSVMLDGKAVSIKYNSPSMRSRKIFGGLVPYGEVWRAGANNATALHTDADLMIGNLSVPKGDYTIYVLPTEKEWTLIVNKQTGQWGTEYSEGKDLGRVKMALKAAPAAIESFKISLSGSGKAGSLQMEWENSIASVAVKTK